MAHDFAHRIDGSGNQEYNRRAIEKVRSASHSVANFMSAQGVKSDPLVREYLMPPRNDPCRIRNAKPFCLVIAPKIWPATFSLSLAGKPRKGPAMTPARERLRRLALAMPEEGVETTDKSIVWSVRGW